MEISVSHNKAIVPAQYSPIYKVLVMISFLEYSCYRKIATLEMLSFALWAMQEPSRYRYIQDFSDNPDEPLIAWNMDDDIYKIITMAMKSGLMIEDNSGYSISSIGSQLVETQKSDILIIKYLDVNKKLTKKMFNQRKTILDL